jgi:hypothetical protein
VGIGDPLGLGGRRESHPCASPREGGGIEEDGGGNFRDRDFMGVIDNFIFPRVTRPYDFVEIRILFSVNALA